MPFTQQQIAGLQQAALSITGDPNELSSLITACRNAQIVMIGEATHGTHEFYQTRSYITQRLIEEQGFHAVTIEGDWPDAYQINRYVKGQKYTTAHEALASFDRFPTWMWRNVVTAEFADWLRAYNDTREGVNKVGIFGLDLYSLYRSIDIVIKTLEKFDPAAAAEARHHYACFEQFRADPQAYGYAVMRRAIISCAYEVNEQLQRMQQQDWDDLAHGKLSADEAFYLEQNARVVKNAEAYYRSLFTNETSNWNLRDSHMLETLNALINHLKMKGIEEPKIIIWAHNSHLGNASATQMHEQGEYNLGQLVKEQFGAQKAFSIGFTTYDGTVSAAADWHKPVERRSVRPALPESYEALFHAVGLPNFVLKMSDVRQLLPARALERAIGVVYHPQTERMSHYFYANLAEQFDVVIHYDRTKALEPLEKTSEWVRGEVPETYPSGL